MLLSTTSTRHYSFLKHFFRIVMLSDVAKVFERKVWREQVANLNNAARARVGVFNCQQILAKISVVILDNVIKKKTNRMWFSVELLKLHWFGINWHVFNRSECRNCCLSAIIQKIAPQAESGKNFWRRSEHAHASYLGLLFRSPGFSPYKGREERRVQGLD